MVAQQLGGSLRSEIDLPAEDPKPRKRYLAGVAISRDEYRELDRGRRTHLVRELRSPARDDYAYGDTALLVELDDGRPTGRTKLVQVLAVDEIYADAGTFGLPTAHAVLSIQLM